ncbi:MAG: hypothetical protein KGP28_06385 [Bdellovibrionales bacterium]|nr:hypothetical protein [Bdellovibrionales bacterium]
MTKWERRNQAPAKPSSPGSELPVDFLKLIEETMTQALEPGLLEVRKIHPESSFKAQGAIFSDEILLSITLNHGPLVLSATTVHGSVDYNPNAEKPAVNDLLALILDSLGSLFQFYLDPEFPERITQITDASLGALEEAPFEWTPLRLDEGQKTPVHVKIDKANPLLDTLAEDWLKKNDPNYENISAKQSKINLGDAEEFLEERIEAIRAAKAGSGSTGGGPIRH